MHATQKINRLNQPGVVELLGQTLKMVWSEEAGVERVERPIIAPKFLQRANASTEMHGLEAASPSLSLKSLFQMSKHIRWIVLTIVSDFAAANVRLLSWLETQIVAHNRSPGEHGKVLLLHAFCLGHILVGIFTKTFDVSRLISRCFAINFTFRFPPKYNRLVRLLRSQLENDLINGGYIRDAGSTDETAVWELHTARVLSLTLMRQLRTRGREDSHSTGKDESLLREVFGVLRTTLV